MAASTANTSPFSALSSREQKERWICWQKQYANQEKKDITIDTPKETDQTSENDTENHSKVCFVNGSESSIHHAQYSSVLNRIKHAGAKAGRFVDCS